MVDKLHDDEDASAPRTVHQCIDCRVFSPEVETEFTLISSRYGWRLIRVERQGRLAFEWRCPACWQVYKSRRSLARTPAHDTAAHIDLPPSSRVPPSSPDLTPPARDEPPSRPRKR